MPMVGEHLSQVIVDFPVFTVNSVMNLRDETMCPPPLLRCVPLLLPLLEAILPYDLFLVPLALHCQYLNGAHQACDDHTASSDTMRKAQDTLRVLSGLTAVIWRRYFSILTKKIRL